MSAPLSLVCENLISTLVARREYLGMTQREVGMAMGFPEASAQARMADLERGAYAPTLGTLVTWAKVLGLFVRLIPESGKGRKRRPANRTRGLQVNTLKKVA